MKGSLAAGLLFAAAMPAVAAGIDCTKATHRVETIVCGSAALRGLDARLAAAYETAVEGSSDPGPLRADQQAWLRSVRSRCRDAGCVEAAWRQRTERLDDWNEPVPADDTVFAHYRFNRDNVVYNPTLRQWVPARTTDCLSLEKRPDGVSFSLALVQANAHLCHLEGRLAPAGGGFAYVPDPAEPELAECRLRVRFKRDTVVLEDPDGACRAWACGARAGIDGTEFARAGRGGRRCGN